jgi:hypothetical protein
MQKKRKWGGRGFKKDGDGKRGEGSTLLLKSDGVRRVFGGQNKT